MPLPPASVTITGVFVDMVSSTGLQNDSALGRTSAERAAEFRQTLKNPFDRLVAYCAALEEGRAVNMAGDGWCYAFRDPQRAVLCALHIHWCLATGPIQTPHGALQARIGLHTESIPANALDYIHQAGNGAARVQAQAPPGGTVLSRATQALCQDRIAGVALCPLGAHPLKGMPPEELFLATTSPELLEFFASRAGRRKRPWAEVVFAIDQSKHAIDGLRLLDRLGQGGGGEVWRAENNGTRAISAVKLLRADLLKNRDDRALLRQWFQEEASLLQKVQDPKVVRFLDFGEWQPPELDYPLPYIVMEFVPGRAITDVLRGRDHDTKLNCFREVCAGVQALHSEGVIHLDLKPANVLVVEKNGQLRPVVVDLGLAQRFRASRPCDAERLGQGTLAYQAPEQIAPQRGPAGPWTDVHALGVMLFEILTDRLPYPLHFATREEYERLICEEARLQLHEVRGDLPAKLSRIGARATAINPAQRYDSPQALAKALLAPAPRQRVRSKPKKRKSSTVHVVQKINATGNSHPFTIGCVSEFKPRA